MLNEPSSENNKRDVREDITDWSRYRDALHQYGAGPLAAMDESCGHEWGLFVQSWWARWGSNPRPKDYESSALTD